MPRNGSGVYSVYTPGNPVVSGTTIDPTAFNNTTNDLATALTNSLASNGETPVTANLPMAGFKHTGAGNATASGQYLVYGQTLPATAFSGAITGVTTLNMSGTLTTAGAITGVTDLTTTGNTILGSSTTNTLNVGAGGITKDASGNVGLGTVPAFGLSFEITRPLAVASLNSTTSTNPTQVQLRRGNSVYGILAAVGAADGVVTGSLAGDFVYRIGVGGNGKHLWSVDDGASIAMSLNQAKLLTVNGGINTASADNTGLGIAISRNKTATTSRNSTTTPTDDPHLIAPLSVGTWSIDIWVPIWATTSGAGGFKAQLAFSGTSTSSTYSAIGQANALAFLGAAAAFGSANNAATIGTNSAAADWIRFSGSVVVTVAGNLSFQWAQNSSNANAANVGIGGFLNCTKVG